MEEKKKSNIGIILLVIVLLCAAFAGGYFVNEKGLIGGEKETPKEEEKEEKKEEDKVTVYDVTDEKILSLLGVLGFIEPGNCHWIETFANDKKFSVDDIDSRGAYTVTSAYFTDAERSKWPDTVSFEDFKKQVAKRFGKDYKFEVSEKFGKGKECVPYYYDSSSNSFKKQETACGWTCGPSSTYKVVSAVDKNGVLKMNVKVLFYVIPENSNEGVMYGDYNKTNKIGTFSTFESVMPTDDLFAKTDTYEFTFKNEDDNYVFVSSELKK